MIERCDLVHIKHLGLLTSFTWPLQTEIINHTFYMSLCLKIQWNTQHSIDV